MRVLAIMCHPDDMELSCSGTLIKCKQRGDTVIAFHAANGNLGHVVIEPEELAVIRAAEARKAASLAGIELINGTFGDLTVNSADVSQQLEITRIIRYAKPDFIITHHPNDYCSDHVELSKLVFKASFDASCPHFHPELGEATPVTPIYYADTSRSLNFIPTEYVDITDVMDLKEQMLSCHESQLVWLKDHDDIDIIEIQRTNAAQRGSQCDVKYAEAFTQFYGAQRLRTYRMLP